MSPPERELSPDRSPLDRFGYELRKWRKTDGLSQARLGALAHVSGHLVHKIEIADRRPSRDFAVRCDEALGARGALIRAWEDFAADVQRKPDVSGDIDRLSVAIDRTSDQGIAVPGSEIITVTVVSLTGESVPVAVDRRAFVAGAASMPIVGWLGRSVPQMPQAMPDGNLDDIVRDMMSLRVVLTKQDNILGPGVAAPTVIHQLSILETLSRSASGSARESLRGLQASYAEFAGWLSDELGDRRAGQFWTDRALEWAHETDDDLIVGYVLARKAQRSAEVGDAAAAISLARAAQRHGALTDRVRAAAAQYEALGHASAGQETEFRASIDRAHGLIASAAPAVADELAIWCTPGYLTMHEASGWAKLGNPIRAIATYKQGLAGWPHEFRRDEGLYYGRLARAYASAENPEEAADTGQRALDIAVGTGSARILAELAPLRSLLANWQELPLVRNFLAGLTQAASWDQSQSRKQLT